jgi:catechol 2,3-dioxygenase-like lactoylglutathione lyase family enzyme
VSHRPACPVVRPTAGLAVEHRRGALAGGRIGNGSRGSFEHKQPRTGNLARERLAIADREERVPATGCRGELIDARRRAATTSSASMSEITWSRVERMALKRMDNVGIVVEDLEATIEFFRELGLELEGRAMVEGEWAGRVTGLGDQQVEIAMMRMPDGHGRLELSRFLAPPVVADHRRAPVNALGYLRVMFAVDDIDETLARLSKHGAELVSSEVVQYEDTYRLCYVRGPGGVLIGLGQELG